MESTSDHLIESLMEPIALLLQTVFLGRVYSVNLKGSPFNLYSVHIQKKVSSFFREHAT